MFSDSASTALTCDYYQMNTQEDVCVRECVCVCMTCGCEWCGCEWCVCEWVWACLVCDTVCTHDVCVCTYDVCVCEEFLLPCY